MTCLQTSDLRQKYKKKKKKKKGKKQPQKKKKKKRKKTSKAREQVYEVGGWQSKIREMMDFWSFETEPQC